MQYSLRELPDDLIVTGDFNATGAEWGMPEVNAKDRMILEMAARLGQVVVNEGSVQVLAKEIGSDYQYISFMVSDSMQDIINTTRALP